MTPRHLVAAFLAVTLATSTASARGLARMAGPRGGGDADALQESGRAAQGDLLPPVSLDRIRRALDRDPVIRLPEPQGPVFTVTIEGRLPSFSDFVGEDQLKRGPAPTTSMTHREFLAMVSPPQTQSFGAFTPGELLQVAATSAAVGLGGQWLIQSIKDAIRNKREREAREEVRAVLAELERREREKAGEKPQPQDRP